VAAETLLQTFFSRLGFEVDTKGLEEYQNKVTELSKKLLEFSGITSLSIGGLFELTRRSTEGLAAVQKMSETYDIATDTLAAFNRMGKDFDITSESMMSGIGHLSVAMGAVAAGQGRYLTKILKELGLSVKDSAGNMKDMRSFLGDVAERMTTMQSAERNLLVTRLGLDPGMVRMLRNGREEFERLYDEASKGLPFRKEDYERAEQFEVAFNKAKGALGVMTAAIGLQLMPMFQRAMTSFLTWWHSNGERVMERIRFWIGSLVTSAGNVLDWIGRLAGDTDALTLAMKALGAAVAFVVAQKFAQWLQASWNLVKDLGSGVVLLTKYMLGLTSAEEAEAAANLVANIEIYALIAALLALAAVIYLIIDDYETWRKGGDSIIGRILKQFQGASEGVKRLWLAVRDIATAVWNSLKAIWSAAADAIGDALGDVWNAFKALWPVVKPMLIGLAIALGIVLVAVIGLAGAAVWLAAKFVSAIAHVNQIIAELFTSPDEAIENLKNWVGSIVEWILDQSFLIGAAFETVFAQIFNEIGNMFLDMIVSIVKKGAEILNKWTFGLSSKIGLKPEDVDKTMDEWANKWSQKSYQLVAEAQARQREVETGLAPPPIAGTAAPFAPPAFAADKPSVNAQQQNSNNTTVNANIQVATPDDAAKAVDKMQENAARKRKQQAGRNLAAVAG
jgi:hypothetical protein